MVISLVEALSCMDANTRSTEIAEFTDRVFIISHAIYSPVIDLTRSWRRIRCCSIFHPTKDLTTMANGSPNHVVPSSMMETFLPSISALISLVSSATMSSSFSSNDNLGNSEERDTFVTTGLQQGSAPFSRYAAAMALAHQNGTEVCKQIQEQKTLSEN